MRSFVGGLELIVSLLKSDDREVSLADFLTVCRSSLISLLIVSNV